MIVTNGRCNARRCMKEIRHDKLFCVAHWVIVPERLRTMILELYTVGQNAGDAIPLASWISAVNESIDAIENAERIAR